MISRAWLVPVLALTLAACGSSGDPPAAAERSPAPTETPSPPPTENPPAEPGPAGGPTRAEVAVIRGWSDTLRAGRVAAAARYFAVPALVSNPAPVLRLENRAAVRTFNRALPCGARLIGAERGERSLVIATFRLTERPGAGSCGTGTGELARTAFRIRDDLIVQWLRVSDPELPDVRES